VVATGAGVIVPETVGSGVPDAAGARQAIRSDAISIARDRRGISRYVAFPAARAWRKRMISQRSVSLSFSFQAGIGVETTPSLIQ